MHYPDRFISLDVPSVTERTSRQLVDGLKKYFNIEAVLVCRLNEENDEVHVCASVGLPIEPFNGNLNYAVKDVIEDCFKVHPAPHIHSIAGRAISNLARRQAGQLGNFHKTAFVPIAIEGRHYVVFVFISDTDSPKKISEDAIQQIAQFVVHFDAGIEFIKYREHILVTERYIKEVGHDIATSVQAIIAKAHNIKDGRVPMSALASKAAEIELEILSIWATAENLGIAIGPIFKLKDVVDFDLLETIRSSVLQYSAEASERHLQFISPKRTKPLMLWGEEKAIQFCLRHLILNAIKYSYGGNNIEIEISESPTDVSVHIFNVGLPLPEGDELKRIWDFGERGKKAKDLHVNGSGIGLFTVKKIINAHYGDVCASKIREKTRFTFTIPKKVQLQREIGLLC